MAYPNETSRSTKATPSGAPYTEVVLSLNGDRCIVCIPDAYSTLSEPVQVVKAHGFTGTENIINGNFAPCRNAILDAGWIVSSSFARGDAWGNDAAQQAYVDLATWVDTNVVDTAHVLLHGSSMGGLTMLLVYANDLLIKTRACVVVDAALNLAADYAIGSFQASMETAYGFSGSGGYAAATAGHDPLLLPSARFVGKRVQLSASYDDTLIIQEDHTDQFLSTFAGVPAAMDLVQTTGGHVTPGHYQPEPTMAFYESSVSRGVVTPLNVMDGLVWVWDAEKGKAWPARPRIWDPYTEQFQPVH